MKKFLALLLSVAMILSLGLTPALAAEPETVAKAPVQFSDMSDDHWAKSSIDRWSGYGIVNGDEHGHVNADMPLRRCEMAQVLVNLLGLTQEAENTFGDLTGKEWYAGTILKCAAAGIMKGDGVNCNPVAPVSREEAIVMFGRAMGVRPAADPDLTKFEDAGDVADWAAPYMASLTQMGILNGVDDGSRVAPKGEMNRASTFALLDKAIAVYADEPGEYTADNANGFVVVNSAAEEAGQVVISGEAAGVVVSNGTTDAVAVKDMVADTVKVDAPVDVTVEGKGTVLGSVQLNDAATVDVAKGVQVDTLEANAPATVTNKGTVDNLIANDAVKVDNQGTVKDATVNADDVVVDGKPPKKMDVAEGVSAPTNSKGDTVKPSRPSGSTASGPAPTPTPTVAEYTISVDVDPTAGGAVTTDPAGKAKAGATVKVTAKAAEGYELGDVTYTVGNDTAKVEMTGDEGSFTMPEGNVTVRGSFKAVTVTPPTPDEVDFTELDEAIAAANAAKTGITIKEDSVTAADVDEGVEFYSQSDVDKLITAISKAGSYKQDQNVTQDDVDGAVTTLNNAVAAFKTKIKTGTKPNEPVDVPVESVSLNETSLNLDLAGTKTATLTATVTPENATNKTVAWTSDAESVATVDSKGVVTAVGVGEATITAAADNKTASCTVTVINSKPTVSTPAELTAALADSNVTKITVSANFVNATGDTKNDYEIYEVTHPVSIKGETAQTMVKGSFVVKSTADGTSFEDLTIQSYGCADASAKRNAISANVANLTVRNCRLVCSANSEGQLGNGLMIMPSAAEVNYTITDNTFEGFQNVTESGGIRWASSGLMITGGLTKDYLGMTVNGADATNVNDETLITDNTFTNCKTDYVRDSYTGGSQVIFARCNSTVGTSLNFAKAADNATYYINGAISRESDTTLKSGTTLKFLGNGSLAIKAGSRLFVENGVIIENADKSKITGDVRYGALESGVQVYDLREEVNAALTSFKDAYYNKTAYLRYVDAAYKASSSVTQPTVAQDLLRELDDTATNAYYLYTFDFSGEFKSVAINNEAIDASKYILSSVGNAAALYSMPYRVTDNKLSMNLLFLMAMANQNNGNVKITVTSTKDSKDLTTEFTFKIFDYPTENTLKVSKVESLLNGANTQLTAGSTTGNNFTYNKDTNTYTVTGTFTPAEGDQEDVLVGVQLTATVNSAENTVLYDASKAIIDYDLTASKGSYFFISLTAMAEPDFGDKNISYAIYPVWDYADGNSAADQIIVPGYGTLTIEFNFTPLDTTPTNP